MTTSSTFFPSPLDRSTRTVGEIIRDAHTKIGVIDSARQLTADEARDGLNALNDLLEQWSIESLNVFRVGDIVFATIAGQSVYKIGPGEFIDSERPQAILEGLRGDDLISVTQSASIAGLTESEARYDPGYPSGTIYLGWSPEGEIVTLKVNQELRRYEDISEQHGLPPGYARPLVHALAIELCSSFNVDPPAALIRNAATSKASLRKIASLLRIEPANTGLACINHPGV